MLARFIKVTSKSWGNFTIGNLGIFAWNRINLISCSLQLFTLNILLILHYQVVHKIPVLNVVIKWYLYYYQLTWMGFVLLPCHRSVQSLIILSVVTFFKFCPSVVIHTGLKNISKAVSPLQMNNNLVPSWFWALKGQWTVSPLVY